MEILECSDPVKLVVLEAVVETAKRFEQERREDQAVRIANKVGQLFRSSS